MENILTALCADHVKARPSTLDPGKVQFFHSSVFSVTFVADGI